MARYGHISCANNFAATAFANFVRSNDENVNPRHYTSVDTSNPATHRHRKTGHHAGTLRLVIEEW